MQKCIEIIEDPAKVAAIQKFFGVTYKRKLPVKTINQNEYLKEESVCMIRRSSLPKSSDLTNIKASRDSSNDSTKIASVPVETPMEPNRIGGKKLYTVKYKFWYYFFISVTHLGDVAGYALVLPFLFWNVDAVVARKLVLVWTAVMYVGMPDFSVGGLVQEVAITD